MINEQANRLIEKEPKRAKKASIAIGWLQRIKNGPPAAYMTIWEISKIGDCIFEIGSTTKTFTGFALRMYRMTDCFPEKIFKSGFHI